MLKQGGGFLVFALPLFVRDSLQVKVRRKAVRYQTKPGFGYPVLIPFMREYLIAEYRLSLHGYTYCTVCPPHSSMGSRKEGRNMFQKNVTDSNEGQGEPPLHSIDNS